MVETLQSPPARFVITETGQPYALKIEGTARYNMPTVERVTGLRGEKTAFVITFGRPRLGRPLFSRCASVEIIEAGSEGEANKAFRETCGFFRLLKYAEKKGGNYRDFLALVLEKRPVLTALFYPKIRQRGLNKGPLAYCGLSCPPILPQCREDINGPLERASAAGDNGGFPILDRESGREVSQ